MNVFAAVKKWAMGVAAAAVLGMSAGTVVDATQVARSPWLSVDRAHKTATVRIVAGYNGNNGGFNFDGYSAGAMTVTVPVGWTIDVVFSNDSKLPHSVLVVPYAKRLLDSGFRAVFPGAATPDATRGMMGGKPESFHFRAARAGRYALVCGVPGHSHKGLWDVLVISPHAKLPGITAKQPPGGKGSGQTGGSGSSGGW